MESITVGLDLAKQVFSVCIMDAQGRVTQRRELKRDGLAEWLAQLRDGSLCSSAALLGSRVPVSGLAATAHSAL